MLSSTAEKLYWACRYIERAEMTSRLLDVANRISLTTNKDNKNNEWESILLSTAVKDEYLFKNSKINQKKVEKFLFFDDSNKSSIKNCVKSTRENFRMVRNRITREVWDVINSTYQELQDISSGRYKSSEIPNLCSWIKQKSSMLKGAIISTQLSSDCYDFMNLGYYVERADNIIRFIDVKNFISPINDKENNDNDYQWGILLRTLAAYTQYRLSYGVNMSQDKIAHFLIFNNTNPRSLFYSLENIKIHLKNLSSFYNLQSGAFSSSRKIISKLSDLTVKEIFENGFNDFLSQYSEDINSLHVSIRNSYFGGVYNVLED